MIWFILLFTALLVVLCVLAYGPVTRGRGTWMYTNDPHHNCAAPKLAVLSADNRVWVCSTCRQAWRYAPMSGWYKA